MTYYEPELGQAIFGNPTGDYDVPGYARALVGGLVAEIGLVFWNREQREWNEREDPKIPDLHFRAYYWGDDDAPEASKPNLQVERDDVEVRWYKHPGRGLSVNRDVPV